MTPQTGREIKTVRSSQEWREKISAAKRGIWIDFACDYCGKSCSEQQSHFRKKKRHFCARVCYTNFRRDMLPPEEHNAYRGGGMSIEEKTLRIKARSILNHAVRDGKLVRMPCEACGNKYTQAHHHDYSKPLEVKWLCVKCHWQEHKLIYEHPNLLNKAI